MCDNYTLMIQIKIENIVSLADIMFFLSGYKFKHVVRQEWSDIIFNFLHMNLSIEFCFFPLILCRTHFQLFILACLVYGLFRSFVSETASF